MKAEIKQRSHIVCPYCGHDDGFSCDHITGSFGPWHCKACGYSIRGTRTADGSFDIEQCAERRIDTVDVLLLKPNDKPVYFVLKGMRFEYPPSSPNHDPNRDEADSKRFFYEEHSCPTNWLEPKMVYYDGDADPHGLLEFVATRDESTFPPDETWGPNARDQAFVDFIESVAVKS